MLKSILLVFLLFISLSSEEVLGGQYTFQDDKNEYALSLGEEDHFELIKKNSSQNQTIQGKYKLDNKKIILFGEQVLENKLDENGKEEILENKYKGNPIRVHVQNRENKTILVLNAFGKILKLVKL
jgi:hypothetical protein